jgi:hypothetical protein
MGGHITCSHLECPRPTAVDELLQDKDVDHIVHFEGNGFTVRHPILERLDDQLLDCKLHLWIADTWPDVPPGRYRAVPGIFDPWNFLPVEES